MGHEVPVTDAGTVLKRCAAVNNNKDGWVLRQQALVSRSWNKF